MNSSKYNKINGTYNITFHEKEQKRFQQSIALGLSLIIFIAIHELTVRFDSGRINRNII